MYSFQPDKYIFWKWLLIISGFLFVLFYLEWWLITFSFIPDLNFILIYTGGTLANILLFSFIIYKPKSITINDEFISFKDSKGEIILMWTLDITEARYKKIGSRWIFFTKNSKPIVYGFDGLNKKDIRLLNSLIHNNLCANGFNIDGKYSVTYRKNN